MCKLTLNWIKCQNDVWCDLKKVNLDHEHFEDLIGVYIIWSNASVIRLGSGVIKERIYDHRSDFKITAYPNLKVTWAAVDQNKIEGVEKFLSESLNPLIGERFPDSDPISVNLPW